MKKFFLVLLTTSLLALDYPGDAITFDEDPTWSDPTVPDDIDGRKEKLRQEQAIKEMQRRQELLNGMDEAKLIKLKQALDILFAEEKQQAEKEEIIYQEEIKKPKNTIEINIRENGKSYKPTNNKQKDNIEINFN